MCPVIHSGVHPYRITIYQMGTCCCKTCTKLCVILPFYEDSEHCIYTTVTSNFATNKMCMCLPESDHLGCCNLILDRLGTSPLHCHLICLWAWSGDVLFTIIITKFGVEHVFCF